MNKRQCKKNAKKLGCKKFIEVRHAHHDKVIREFINKYYSDIESPMTVITYSRNGKHVIDVKLFANCYPVSVSSSLDISKRRI